MATDQGIAGSANVLGNRSPGPEATHPSAPSLALYLALSTQFVRHVFGSCSGFPGQETQLINKPYW